MSSIFGGANQFSGASQSNEHNQAYPYLQGALSGNVSNGGQAGNQMANMLGLNGAQSQNQGFQNWQNSTGYKFGLDQGMNSITGNAATQGLLNSGGTLKAMDTYGQNYANTQYGNYMGQLQGLLGSGIQSGNVISGAGGVRNETGASPGGGLGGMLGGIFSSPGAQSMGNSVGSTIGSLLPKVFGL